MVVTYKTISKFGILLCLIYVMWYKWVFGDNTLILYSAAAIAIVSMIIGLMMSRKSITDVFPQGCINDIRMCCYSFVTGLLVASSKGVLFSSIITYLAFSMVCLSFCYASYGNGFKWLLKGFIVIAIVCTFWTLTNGYYKVGYGMVLSPTNNPHTLAFVMILGLFSVAYLSHTKLESFCFYFSIGLLFLYMIIQCGSRKCLLASAFILIPWLWIQTKTVFRYGTKIQKVAMILLLLTLAIGCIYYFFNYFVLSNAYERMANIEESEANQARMSFFEFGFNLFKKSPVFGVGLGQFAVLNPSGAYSHSTIPEAIASWGMLGAWMYFTPIVNAGKNLIRLIKIKKDKQSIMIFSLYIMELFMAFLQIYFYILQHMMVWAIIYFYIKSNKRTDIEI